MYNNKMSYNEKYKNKYINLKYKTQNGGNPQINDELNKYINSHIIIGSMIFDNKNIEKILYTEFLPEHDKIIMDIYNNIWVIKGLIRINNVKLFVMYKVINKDEEYLFVPNYELFFNIYKSYSHLINIFKYYIEIPIELKQLQAQTAIPEPAKAVIAALPAPLNKISENELLSHLYKYCEISSNDKEWKSCNYYEVEILKQIYNYFKFNHGVFEHKLFSAQEIRDDEYYFKFFIIMKKNDIVKYYRIKKI
jgi:hypothetical protein